MGEAKFYDDRVEEGRASPTRLLPIKEECKFARVSGHLFEIGGVVAYLKIQHEWAGKEEFEMYE